MRALQFQRGVVAKGEEAHFVADAFVAKEVFFGKTVAQQLAARIEIALSTSGTGMLLNNVLMLVVLRCSSHLAHPAFTECGQQVGIAICDDALFNFFA